MGHKIRAFINAHGTFTLPQNKPDIEFVLRATAVPNIEYASAIDKKIIFRGYLDLCMEYVAKICDCSQPVYFAHFKLPFNSGVIEHCRIRAGINVQLKAKAEYVKVTAIDCRRIDCVVVVDVALIQVGSVCDKLPPHICLPYTSQCYIFCGNKPHSNTDACSSEHLPCHPTKPCDNECHHPAPCDCPETGCFSGSCTIHPVTSCDCTASDRSTSALSNYPSESCDCTTCSNNSTYYQSCFARNITVGS